MLVLTVHEQKWVEIKYRDGTTFRLTVKECHAHRCQVVFDQLPDDVRVEREERWSLRERDRG